MHVLTVLTSRKIPAGFYLALLLCGLLASPSPVPAAGGHHRAAVLAGSWYPADPHELDQAVRAHLQAVQCTPADGELTALIAPHAGFPYSGRVAAHAYQLLAKRSFDSVVVIAPSHRASFEGVSVYDRGDYETPLGRVRVDHDLIRAIKADDDRIRYVAEAHASEHALEIQLPWLQTVMPGFKLVPLVMGRQTRETCQRLAQTLVRCVQGRSVLLVASTDLSHFHPYESAQQLDATLIRHVSHMDVQGLLTDLSLGRCEACGAGPLVTVLQAAKLLGANRAQILQAQNSGDVTGDHSRVVGYLAAALWSKTTTGGETLSPRTVDGLPLSAADRAQLHRIARAAVVAAVNGTAVSPPTELSPDLMSVRGAFVTLRKQDRLRGCIGHVLGRLPLAETVFKMAAAAALEDPRFDPVTPAELQLLTCEISVLSPLRWISDVDAVEVGRHGLYIRQGSKAGLLLPQVAVENGWDRNTFLEQTCRKAGLPANAWQHAQTRIYVYSAEVF